MLSGVMLTPILCAAVMGQGMQPTLFVDGLMIGSMVGSKWVVADQSKASDQEFGAFEIGVGGLRPKVTVWGVEWIEEIGANYVENDRVLWTGKKPVYKRPITFVHGGSSDYGALIKEAVSASFKKDFEEIDESERPVMPDLMGLEVVSEVKVDLDGDGKDEVLLEVNHKGAEPDFLHNNKPGMFSCVVLLTDEGGQKKSVALGASVGINEGDYLYEFRLVAVVDLDGDGGYEVVVTTRGQEDNGATVYGFKGGKASPILEYGVGV